MPVFVEQEEFGTIGFAIHVQERTVEQRTGLLGDQTDGWVWDRRSQESGDVEATYYRDYLFSEGPIEGFLTDDFRDGVIHGLRYRGIDLKRQGADLAWTPETDTGWYSIGPYRKPLFSDEAMTVRLDPADTVDDLGRIQVPSLNTSGPFFLAMYARDQRLRSYPTRVWRFLDINDTEPFTGYIDDVLGERVTVTEPWDASTITLVDPNKFEARVDPATGIITLNGPGIYAVGDPSMGAEQDVVESTWEAHGDNAAGRILYTKFFPVVGDVSVVVVVDDGLGGITLEAYTEIDNWSQAVDPAGFYYILDRDLGIIYLSGYEPEKQFLSNDFASADTSFGFVSGPTFNMGIPSAGIVDIGGTETLSYEFQDLGTFTGLTRGASVDHLEGEEITWQPQGGWAGSGPGETSAIYVAYQAGPRLDCEMGLSNTRSANYASWLDLHPVRRIDSDGVLQLTTSALNVNELVLEIDANRLQNTSLYGPIWFGTSSHRLTATAFDVAGNPVPDINITIEILGDGSGDGVGTLNSQGKSYTGLSNLKGQVYALHSALWSETDGNLIITDADISHNGADTEIVLPIAVQNLALNGVWLYQILKYDPLVGTTGTKVDPTSSGTHSILGEYFVIDRAVDPDLYEGGTYFVTDGVSTFTGEISRVVNELTLDSGGGDFDNEFRVYVDAAVPGWALAEDLWLIPRDSYQWDPASFNGSRVLVFRDTGGGEPKFAPRFPDQRLGDDTLVYQGVNLPLPDAEDRNNNVGAYSIVCNRFVKFQAHCTDPATGRTIVSNEIRAYVSLPASLIGDHTYDGNQAYGFRVVSSTRDASALGGANYWTINPIAQNLNRLSLTAAIP